ncbi:MAG: hypothetical protein GF311_03410 [Candidatus Lokiarchaeota archaeon]|nr:hypothetical protein [Candidatus Lokiarchaeota archaeon]
MNILIIAIVSAIALIIVILLLNKYYWNRSISKVVKKYFADEEKQEAIDKYKEISKIVEETEKEMERSIQQKTELVKSQFKKAERELIKKGTQQYTKFSSSLRSAMPETEEERKQDMEDLKGAINLLESLDEAAVEAAKKKIDVGLGMFYDKMSRKFKKIIDEKSLDQFEFIPVPRLKYHAFQEIKNIKDEDFLPILNIMIETNLLKDIIEINPALHLIKFTDDELELTRTEKVVLTFAYEEEKLTKRKLVELTEWDTSYANKILDGLSTKGIINLNATINVESFNPPEERKKWKQLIRDIIKQNQQKEEEKFQKSLLRRQQLQEKLAKSKETPKALEISQKESEQKEIDEVPEEIEFGKKPDTKPLPGTKIEDEPKFEENIQDIKDKDSLISAMEALDQELKSSRQQNLTEKRDEEEGISELSLEISEMGEGTQNLDDLISSLILNYDEKYSMVNGGFVQFEKINEYILNKDERITGDMVRTVLNELNSLQMINKIIKIEDATFYTFNKMELNEDQKDFIHFLVNKKPMSKQMVIEELEWDEQKVLETMKSLQEKNLLRLENDKIIIPGANQKEE